MEDYIGKICPFCQTEITAEDEVFICQECKTPHHKKCWVENNGCAAPGCKEQNNNAQHTDPAAVCANCGAELQEDQAFCPKCGTPKGAAVKNVCGQCGAELQEDQAFCPKCGQRVGTVADPSQTKGLPASNNKKKKPLVIAIAAGVAVIAIVLTIVLITALGSGGKTAGNRGSERGNDAFNNSFNDMYGGQFDKAWCKIADDGSFMKIDTNPYDTDSDDFTPLDYLYNNAATDAIERVNKELGFSDALMEKMNNTTWSQGVQTDSNKTCTVTWTYHPDKGLEVMYELKK